MSEKTTLPAEQTLVLIKPDGLKKSLTGNILSRLSETRLEIAGARMVKVSRELAEQHYIQHRGKFFYEELVKYIMGDYHKRHKVMALVYHGPEAIQKVRKICGSTNPEEAEPESIRGAYGRITTSGVYENVMHSSGSSEDAEREIKLWFSPEELVYHIYPYQEKEFEKVKKLIWS